MRWEGESFERAYLEVLPEGHAVRPHPGHIPSRTQNGRCAQECFPKTLIGGCIGPLLRFYVLEILVFGLGP